MMGFVHSLHLHNAAVDILRLCLWLVILSTIFAPLERLFYLRHQNLLRRQIRQDLFYYFFNSLFVSAILSLPVALVGWIARKLMPEDLVGWATIMPVWMLIAVSFVVAEIGIYWGHRWSHEVPFLWQFHSVHHSAEEIDFLVNTRAHPLDMVFTRFCAIVPLFVLGLAGPTSGAGGSSMPVLITLAGTTWGFFIHSNVRWRLGPLEWLVSSPMFHHWHHTKTGPIDHNYAANLPWVDRMFGTHYSSEQWPDSNGIEAQMPDSIVGQLLYPLNGQDETASSQQAQVDA